ncbi:MAG: hypothetical protein HOL85_02135 [Rhodospirillaceae bacterium]|jgi:hypothetical protein|nr:hypothetical protein [Rhodospirillaceae bacterium]MBT6136973.1 hypothetical protein [Rhodospirillaceae bacterium]
MDHKLTSRGLVTAACLVLAGCVTASDLAGSIGSGARRSYLDHAGRDGPVLAVAVNLPASLSAEATGQLVARAAGDAITETTTRFTNDPGLARNRDYRLVVVFDPPRGTAPSTLCEGAPVGVTQGRPEMLVGAIFCARGQALAGARASGPRPRSPNDPALSKLVRAAIGELFPTPIGGPKGASERALDGIQLSPGIRLTRSPLEGIF